MRPISLRLNRGASFRSGKRTGTGVALKARNSRYIPGDDRMRLWALLGRLSAGTLPVSEIPHPPEPEEVRAIFPWVADDETGQTQPSKLWAVKGNAVYETSLTSPSKPTRVFGFGLSKPWQTGRPCAFENQVFYPIGTGGGAGLPYMIGRNSDGWFYASHKDPSLTTGVLSTPSKVSTGTFTSTTPVRYTFRIYDADTDSESAHLDVHEVSAFSNINHVLLTFSALVAGYALGTHVRIYRTLLSETPGIYYRIDGSDEGIDIADFAAGYTHQDTLDNETAQTYGIVRADGEEGQIAWAEHGGIPPKCRGLTVFKNHLVAYGINERETDIIYSAQGYPVSFPVDWSYEYQYWLRFVSPQNDIVQCALPVSDYLIVWGAQGIWRVSHLPTYTTPGFDRLIQDQFVTDHGCVGRNAADSFGIGGEENQHAIYMSAQLGLCYTNAVYAKPVMLNANWLERMTKSDLRSVVVLNNPRYQEVWVFYPAPGEKGNTQALVVNYEHLATIGVGLRVTGPVDVKCKAACSSLDNSGRARMYLIDDDRTIYVQDSGNTDEQKNTNDDGDIAVEWSTGRKFPNGSSGNVTVQRGILSGTSGEEKTLTVYHRALDGTDEHSYYDTVKLGPGETADGFLVKATGQGHRADISYTGATGYNYNEEDPGCAPCFDELEWEVDASGRQHRTRTA